MRSLVPNAEIAAPTQNLHHAPATLRDKTGTLKLKLDPGGDLTPLFDSGMAIDLVRGDDAAVGTWTPLDGLGCSNDGAAPRPLLEADRLGQGTGVARLALSPARDRSYDEQTGRDRGRLG